MSTDVLSEAAAPAAAQASPSAPARRRRLSLHPSLRLPLLLGVVNAVLFMIVQPNVADLQAALARETATAHGVGLTYWFQWFGGGTTPGHYSVISPLLSSWISAPLLGALSTVALTPLLDRVLAPTYYQVAGTWVGTVTAGLNLWSGRIAFALGAAIAVVALIGLRERRIVLAVLGTVGAAFASPVTGAFLGLALFAAWLVVRAYQRLALALGVLCAATLLFVAAYYGTPGPQSFAPGWSMLVSAMSLLMLVARPAAAVRVVAWLTAVASPILLVVPNGMGSNLVRMPLICLPVAVVATARVRRVVALLCVAPAVVACAFYSVTDLQTAAQPAAAPSYYKTLADHLDRMPELANYRLEVVQNRDFHTADYVLLDHAALATGWETQEQRALNPVLSSPQLDATTYRIWLNNNAVGYVAFDRRSPDHGHEYQLVADGLLYLTPVWRDATWTLYRVRGATPIVPRPARLLAATQSALTIRIPCACTVPVRVRWSKFLTVSPLQHGRAGVAINDLTGWTVLRVPAPGTYRLAGRTI